MKKTMVYQERIQERKMAEPICVGQLTAFAGNFTVVAVDYVYPSRS